MKNGNDKIKKALSFTMVALLWLSIWLIASAAARRAGYGLLAASPKEVFFAFRELLRQKSFYVSCAASLLRVLTGWFSGLVLGSVLAAVTERSKPLKLFFAPALHIVKATPVASFIILALVLMNRSRVPAFTGTLISLPIVWANISEGINAADPALLEMAAAFGMGRKNELKYIRLPALRPYFTAAATTAMGLTWKACIAAEVICTPQSSIGAGIYNAKVYLETPSLFAWTLTVILFSVLLEYALKLILKKSGKKNDDTDP